LLGGTLQDPARRQGDDLVAGLAGRQQGAVLGVQFTAGVVQRAGAAGDPGHAGQVGRAGASKRVSEPGAQRHLFRAEGGQYRRAHAVIQHGPEHAAVDALQRRGQWGEA
jgi:hypothetical protein